MSEYLHDELKTNGRIVGSSQEVLLLVRFTPTELRDLIDCAEERGYTELGDMAREILLENIFR